MEAFYSEIMRQIESRRMLIEGERGLLAVSGGPDRLALLIALPELRKRGKLRVGGFHVAHLNHRLRGRDSDRDADFVRQQADHLNFPLTLEKIDVLQYAKGKKLSLETAARECRYEFLAKTARAQQCGKIVPAHNADDNAETVLHRILRGTGIRGLSGIPAIRRMAGEPLVTLIRPLLSVRRLAIDAFLQEHGIPYRADKSNQELFCTRNRLRMELLPLLRERYNPNIDAALTHLAEIAGMAQSLSEDAAESLSRITVERTDRAVRLDRESFCAEPRVLQSEILHQAMRRLGAGLRRIGYRQIQMILEAASARGGGERTISLPDGISFQLEEHSFYLIRQKIEAPEELLSSREPVMRISVSVPGTTALPSPGVAFDLRCGGAVSIHTLATQVLDAHSDTLANFLRTKTPREEMLDLDAVEGDLVLRPRQEKDRFYPLGAPGEKTIGDFFTDHKIPLSLRGQITLLGDSKRILYVPAIRISQSARVTPQTRRILHLRWE